MTTAVSPSPAVSPKVQLSARPRACWEQRARRQTRPQRLGRRATLLVALETGVKPCHVMRQRPRHRGTVQVGCRRWCALAPTLEPRAADEGSDTVRTTMLVQALADHPRSGPPATRTAEPMVQMIAVACDDPAASGWPVRPWTPRDVAAEVRSRGMLETRSPRRVGRCVPSGGWAAPAGRVLVQRHAG